MKDIAIVSGIKKFFPRILTLVGKEINTIKDIIPTENCFESLNIHKNIVNPAKTENIAAKYL